MRQTTDRCSQADFEERTKDGPISLFVLIQCNFAEKLTFKCRYYDLYIQISGEANSWYVQHMQRRVATSSSVYAIWLSCQRGEKPHLAGLDVDSGKQ